jgi:hypothetical protein
MAFQKKKQQVEEEGEKRLSGHGWVFFSLRSHLCLQRP